MYCRTADENDGPAGSASRKGHQDYDQPQNSGSSGSSYSSVAERPNQLWCADFTYVSTWKGFAYVEFIIDVFAGMIVSWRGSSSMETSFVLDALEQALWARRPTGTIHHNDKDSQYVSLAYTQRLQDAELLASTGSTVQATLTIMQWPKVSTVFTKRR